MALWGSGSNQQQEAEKTDKQGVPGEEIALDDASGWSTTKRVVGIDLGYGLVKFLDGQEEVSFPSVVGLGQTLKYQSELKGARPGLEAVRAKRYSLDNLMITMENNNYFVGNLAIKQSDIATRSLFLDRAADRNLKVLLATALSLLTQRDNQAFYLVTGLPVNYFAGQASDWGSGLKGYYAVKFGQEGMEKLKSFALKEIRTLPQPLGTFYDQVLNNFGKVANRDLLDLNIGIVDIGFRTTDFAAVNRMEFIEHLSSSSTTALASAYRIIAARLLEDYKLDKENYELDEIIERGMLRIAGKPLDITEIKKEAYARVAQKILSEILSFWEYREFDAILLTGGGGKALAEYLTPQIPNLALVEGPQYANARGYQKLAYHIFGEEA